MLRHLVMFRKHDATDDATIDAIMARLEALVGQIPGLVALHCHRSLPSPRPVVWTFVLDSTIEDAAQLPAYLAHPAHVAVNEWMSPYLADRAVIDYVLTGRGD